MPQPRWRRLALLFLVFISSAVAARADSLITIKSAGITAAEADLVRVAHIEPELPPLPEELASAFEPVSGISHNGAL
jgi:hypothetical protein